MARFRDREFDREADFAVAKPFRFAGANMAIGEPFPKTKATTRTLRLLYESRKLNIVSPIKPRVRPVKSAQPEPLPEPAVEEPAAPDIIKVVEIKGVYRITRNHRALPGKYDNLEEAQIVAARFQRD